MAKTYYEKLRDPRWQRKRLEIMERDGFACRSCGALEETLNVDHAYYLPKAEPWEYPNESLSTLCETCHKKTENARRRILESLAGARVELLDVLPTILKTLTPDVYYSISLEGAGDRAVERGGNMSVVQFLQYYGICLSQVCGDEVWQ